MAMRRGLYQYLYRISGADGFVYTATYTQLRVYDSNTIFHSDCTLKTVQAQLISITFGLVNGYLKDA